MLGLFRRKNKTINEKKEQPVACGFVEESDKLIVEDNDVEISLIGENGFYKLEISDYISLNNHKLDNVISSNGDVKAIFDELPARIFVDDMRVNKGIFYFIIFDNKTYVIYMCDNTLRINEFIKKDIDLEYNKKNVEFERILIYDKETDQHDFTIYRHDECRSSYYCKTYNNYKELPNYVLEFFNWELSKKDAFREINDLISNLENIPKIENIIDINFLKKLFKDSNLTKKRNINE